MIFPWQWRLAAFLFLSTGFLGAQSEFREFTDNQGRTIRAKIFETDGLMVKLELDDGSGFQTPISVFSANDQAFIKSWRPDMSGSSVNEQRVEISQVEVVDGYYHKIGDELGISGVAYENFIDDTPKAEIHLLYGLQHGKYTQWYESTGNKEFEANFYQGKRDGVTTFWYPSGNLQSQISYKADVKHGLSTFWYENGQIKSEGIYHAGQKYGIRTEWYENGQKKSEVNYSNNKPEGVGTNWYPNGQKHISATFTNGLQTGSYMEWHPNGQKKKEAAYDDRGILVSDIVQWDEEGKEIKESRKAAASDDKKKSRGSLFSFFNKDNSKTDIPKKQDPSEPKAPKVKKPRKPLLPPAGDEGYYVRLLGMISVPTDASWRSIHDVEMDSAFAFGASWGRDLGAYRFELEGAYAGYTISSATIRPIPGVEYNLPASGDVDMFSVNFNNFLELEFTPRFEIYGGLGLGLAMRSVEGFSWNGVTYGEENESGFNWQILTGMKFTMFNRHSLLGGYRYISYGDLTKFEDFSSHNFELGYRLNL